MELAPVAKNGSVSIEFSNDGGTYLARLDLRPRSRPDGTLLVNTQVELFVRSEGADGNANWEELTVAGAVYEFPPEDASCAGGVGVSLPDRSARIEVTWKGERLGDSNLRLTSVTTDLSKHESGVPVLLEPG